VDPGFGIIRGGGRVSVESTPWSVRPRISDTIQKDGQNLTVTFNALSNTSSSGEGALF
jgi:hypothetical protein